ncbi:hypothetical protein ACR77J_04505 [Tissierella praeacuta]|uniref:hypothetical protein n=1 Tax=Tissierella TaxID=41273 RepID=UPI0010E5830D|nr:MULTISPECIES: hypothetical protein [Tissierella]TCU75830.1 hypothetical protein EV204_103398 [Tissierella praeacuta]
MEEIKANNLYKKFTLTIPVPLLDEIKTKANLEDISLNRYILSIISQRVKIIQY